MEIKTVLGNITTDVPLVTLPHEHICCYSEYLKLMSSSYLDKERLIQYSSEYLQTLKKRYGLSLLVDCTALNIGRDVSLLKTVSQNSGVHIVCSTGFYYTDEPVLYETSAETLADFFVADAKNVNAGVIKAAVESRELTDFNIKLLKCFALVQKKLGLPIVLHTNACNQNGAKAVKILMEHGVEPQNIMVGHLSDTTDDAYIKEIAGLGCYIGLDRLYDVLEQTYIDAKLKQIATLCEAGYEDQILLSHDASFFNGFEGNPQIRTPRFAFVFEHILNSLDSTLADKLIRTNPTRMLTGK